MKIKAIILFALCFATLTAKAQGADSVDYKGLRFEKITYQQALEQARQQQKMLFVDMSMTGCAPCKYMEKNIFPQAPVGEFYNQHFVSLHLNAMVKGDGADVAAKFNVSAFPTFLFIDPTTGELVHTSNSGKGVEEVLQMGQIAISPGIGSVAMHNKWLSGDRDFDFLIDYYLMSIYERQTRTANEVIDAMVEMKGVDFKDEELNKFFFDFVNSKNNELSKYFLANVQAMIDRYGKEKVFEKIGKLR